MSEVAALNPLDVPRPLLHLVRRFKRELSVAGAYLVLLLALAAFRPSYYKHQFLDNWIDAAPILVASVGMTLVILARHIDISIGSQFSICAVLAGLAAKAGYSMPVVALISIASGAVMGVLNGLLVAYRRLPSIVVTLATMVILESAMKWWRSGDEVRGLPHQFQWFGLSQSTGQLLLILVALTVLALFAFGARWLAAGRAVYAVGSDQEAARLAGVRPARVVFSVFVAMGALTGLAALLNAVRQPAVATNTGAGLELAVIAAVVVGGTAISGGRGSLIGTLIGVALLGSMGTALFFLGLPTQWEQAIQGLIILVAVASDGLFRRTT